MNIIKHLVGEHDSSPTSKERLRLQRELDQVDETLCLYQMLYDDAKCRRDFAEMAYFGQELFSERREKKKLLQKLSGQGVHVCV